MDGFVADVLRITLLNLAALMPIVNPAGNAPIFLSLTRGASADTRAVLSRRIAVNGLVLLVASMLGGTYILAFFGVSLQAVQVGGGLVLTATGWSLLTRSPDEPRAAPADDGDAPDWLARSFYPLTLPVTVGPGSLSIAITLGANRPGRWPHDLAYLVAALLAALGVSLAIYASYRSSERIERWLGVSAMSVFLRLSSFILMCIGVQILWNGVSAMFATLPR
ncbi:MAG: MarC family protein [Acidobacteria bacterium]|nr:MarC family protein [Acidobacteriota bacterium]